MTRFHIALLALLILMAQFMPVPPTGEEAETAGFSQALADKIHTEQAFDIMGNVFTQNLGQVKNTNVKFYSSAGSLAFTDDSVMIYSYDKSLGSIIILSFEDANDIAPIGLEPAAWESNVLRGSQSEGWKSGIPNYHKVVYNNLWDGIDLIYYMSNGSLKYDLVLQPFDFFVLVGLY